MSETTPDPAVDRGLHETTPVEGMHKVEGERQWRAELSWSDPTEDVARVFAFHIDFPTEDQAKLFFLSFRPNSNGKIEYFKKMPEGWKPQSVEDFDG